MDNYSKETINFVDNLVINFAKFDISDETYNLDIDSIPDFTQQKFASFIMRDNLDFASESTGADNYSYDRKMLPSLINLLSNSTDKDTQIDFLTTWRDETTKHFRHVMSELLDQRLGVYTMERLCAA